MVERKKTTILNKFKRILEFFYQLDKCRDETLAKKLQCFMKVVPVSLKKWPELKSEERRHHS